MRTNEDEWGGVGADSAKLAEAGAPGTPRISLATTHIYPSLPSLDYGKGP
jgi:hypothetical protein